MAGAQILGMLPIMAWHLHAVEGDDGRWTCRHGLSVFDSHADQMAAVDHLTTLAREFGQDTVIFVHALGRAARRLGDLE